MLWDWEVEKVCILVGRVDEATDAAHVEDLWTAVNYHHDPHDNFALTKPQWTGFHRKAAKMGTKVLGIGHSHPFPAMFGPSPKDIQLAGQRSANLVYHSQTSTVFWYIKSGVVRQEVVAMPRRLWVMNKACSAIYTAEQGLAGRRGPSQK